MNIYKRTEGNIIKTNLRIKADKATSSDFTINNIIEHLLVNKKLIVKDRDDHRDLLSVCVEALRDVKDEAVATSGNVLSGNTQARLRTLFYPSCRIIHVNLIDSSRTSMTHVRPLSVIEQVEGYAMKVPAWAHSLLVIKIERMTDHSCFASWTLIK